MLIHASSVVVEGKAVLIMGPSGAGKSDMALQLIDRGAKLISDDQTFLSIKDGKLFASPPEAIKGKIEARYAGLVEIPYEKQAAVHLCVELVPEKDSLERLPEVFFHSFLDCSVRGLKLPSYEASTAAKIRIILQGKLMDV